MIKLKQSQCSFLINSCYLFPPDNKARFKLKSRFKFFRKAYLFEKFSWLFWSLCAEFKHTSALGFIFLYNSDQAFGITLGMQMAAGGGVSRTWACDVGHVLAGHLSVLC